jgi:hypothetical protein
MKVHVITNKEIDSKAFTELSEIISHMEKDLRDKIPNDIYNIIEQNKDASYNFKYHTNVDIMPETKALLSVLLSEYLCSDENKLKWKKYDKSYIEVLEKEKKEKYSTNVFQNSKIENLDSNNSDSTSDIPIEYKEENWFKKLINKIKNIFKKGTSN